MGRMSLRAAFLLQFGHDFLSPVSGGEGGKERERERAREGRKGREEGGVGEEGEMDGGRVREREGGAGRDRERERERESAHGTRMVVDIVVGTVALVVCCTGVRTRACKCSVLACFASLHDNMQPKSGAPCVTIRTFIPPFPLPSLPLLADAHTCLYLAI